MNNKKLICGVIGMGVGEKHAIFYNNYKHTKLTKIYEKNIKKRKKLKKKYPLINFVKSENDIYKDKDIKLISIAFYDNFHYKQIVKAAKYKKNIFVEKPICLFLSELKKINLAIKKSNIKLGCNFVLRKNNQFIKIKNIYDKKILGKPFFIEGDYNYGRLNKITKGWRGKIPFYSVTHGGAIHMIDLILWFLKELPYEVKAEGNKIVTHKSKFKFNDFSVGILKFKSGLIAKISSNFGSVTPHHHAFKIFGTKGSIYSDLRGAVLFKNRDQKIKPKLFKLETSFRKKTQVIKNFVDNLILKKNIVIKSNFREIMNSMLISLCIEKSIKTKKTIKIDYKNIKLYE